VKVEYSHKKSRNGRSITIRSRKSENLGRYTDLTSQKKKKKQREKGERKRGLYITGKFRLSLRVVEANYGLKSSRGGGASISCK